MAMVNGILTLDTCRDFCFEGYYDPSEVTNAYESNWFNTGFLKPYFTMKEAMKIVEEVQKHHDSYMHYDKETDAFIYVEGGRVEEYHGVDIDGMHLYPIGAGSWTWCEAGIYSHY